MVQAFATLKKLVHLSFTPTIPQGPTLQCDYITPKTEQELRDAGCILYPPQRFLDPYKVILPEGFHEISCTYSMQLYFNTDYAVAWKWNSTRQRSTITINEHPF